MNWQLGNLAYSLVVTVGGTALGLAILFWLVNKWANTYKKTLPIKPKVIRIGTSLIWLAMVVGAAWFTINSNAPKIILEDRSAKYPSYSTDATIQDLNPNKTTAAERVEQNRRLIEENAVK